MIKPISFGAKYSKSEYYNDSEVCYEESELKNNPDALARYIIREKIENEYIGGYRFPNDFNKTEYEIMSKLKSANAARAYETVVKEICEHEPSKKSVSVDQAKLEKIGIKYSWETKKDQLYHGAKLISHPEGVKLAKEAGIKTIVALEGTPGDSYYKKAKECGLNEICLGDIGNHKLHVFSIIPIRKTGGNLLKELIDDENYWVTMNKDGSVKKHASSTVLDLQEYIDIMDGKNKDLPYPIYYGCCFGTLRTYAWTAIYNILRNEDRTKPLSDEVRTKLAELYEELADAYRD